MESYFPALNLKAKLIVLVVGLLALTLGKGEVSYDYPWRPRNAISMRCR